MTRTSSISGTFVNRQRSPVRVAAASSLRAAFLAPLIATVPGQRPAALDPEDLACDGLRAYSQWNGRASAIARPIRGAADPRGGGARRRGCAAAPAGARPGRPPGRRPRRSPSRAPARPRDAPPAAVSRSISEAMSAVSAMTTTLSGRTWRKPPAMAKDSSAPPLRIRSSPTPSVDTSGAWCGRTPSSPSIRAHDGVDLVRVRQPLRRDDLEQERHHGLPSGRGRVGRARGAGGRRSAGGAEGRVTDATDSRAELRRVLADVVDRAGQEEGLLGQVSALPSRISLNDATVSLIETYSPGRPVKTSATKNGWLMKRCRRRARATVALSSSDSSSMPRMAMMSWRSR